MANTDTDWKSKLAEAEKIATAAAAELKVANEKFAVEMEKVKVLVDAAIKAGGADAEKQWNAFWGKFEEGLTELLKTVREALSKFSEKINWVKNRYWLIGGAVIIIAIIAGLFAF